MTTWTSQEDATLREMYASHTRGEIAAALGRTEGMVRSRCCTLGLNTKAAMPWSEAEKATLFSWYVSHIGKRLELDKLAALLGRQKPSVCREAGRQGLANQRRVKYPIEERVNRGPRFATDEERRAALSEQRKAWIAEHGHPRGALGMKHGEEAKAKMVAAIKRAWADPSSGFNTASARQERSDRLLARRLAGQMRSRYSRGAVGRRADLGGQYFRSRWEANYARYLNLRIASGAIRAWEYEPQTFEFTSIKRGTRSYTPDFKVTALDGSHEWHEVKGWMDQKSRTRLARMARYYPEEKVVIIDQGFFRSALKSGLAQTIPNWERDGRRDQIMEPLGPKPPREMRCPECGTGFTATSASHRFCTVKCRGIAKKRRTPPVVKHPMTSERRAEASRSGRAAMTPERRREIAIKGWEARRATAVTEIRAVEEARA